MKKSQSNRLFIAFLYVLAFLLLREWLVLMTEVTSTGYLMIFLLFAGLSFLLSLLRINWFLSGIAKVIYMFWAVQTIYIEHAKFSIDQILSTIDFVVADIQQIFTGNIFGISNVSRTILLFLLIWMLVYLIRYWIEVRRRIFLFYFTTIILVATADTFTAYSAERSIFMLMMVGLLLLGLLTIARLNERYDVSFSVRQLLSVLVPLIFFLVVSSFFVSISPKRAPVWADPVPFLKGFVDEQIAAEQTISKSGYDENDNHLGGPFVEDDSLVFEAVVDERQYWRVETKDTYTSKGWEQSAKEETPKEITLGEALASEDAAMDHLSSAQLSVTEEFPFIIHPYGLRFIDLVDDVAIFYDRLLDKYITEKNGKPFPVRTYHMTFNEQSFSLQQLRDATIEEMTVDASLEKYLQLPDTLPDRVSELAQSITASHHSVYEKAKAIEEHFKQNDFTYERSDVAIPTGDEDYVDQFLFDTKKGYCDNFSSSMVVMLRTIGIPARWVKGFAPGERLPSDGEEKIYRVSNNEAHSWVEAYIPNIGWMPFEPTIGFDGVADVEKDVESTVEEAEIESQPEDEDVSAEKELREEKTVEDKLEKENNSTFTEWLVNRSVAWGVILSILIAVGAVIYGTRKKWLPSLIIRRYKNTGGSWKVFKVQYEQLVKQLARNGFRRAPNETWMTYANRIDTHFGMNYMKKLTLVYEQGIYGEVDETQDWHQLEEIWKDSIKKTSN